MGEGKPVLVGRRGRVLALLVCSAAGCQVVAGLSSLSDEPLDAGTLDANGSGSDTGVDAFTADTSLPSDSGDAATAADSSTVDAGVDASVTYELIDDMEANTGIIFGKGRNGFWYTAHDTTGGTLSPSSPPLLPSLLTVPRSPSTRGVHVSGSGFTTWGAIFGFDLNSSWDGVLADISADAGPKHGYNASAYAGVTFFARREAAAAAQIRLDISDTYTDPVGNACFTCYDTFGSKILLTTDWAQYTLLFKDLTQQGFGNPLKTALDSTNIYTLQFTLPASSTYDYWIDDISFIRK